MTAGAPEELEKSNCFSDGLNKSSLTLKDLSVHSLTSNYINLDHQQEASCWKAFANRRVAQFFWKHHVNVVRSIGRRVLAIAER